MQLLEDEFKKYLIKLLIIIDIHSNQPLTIPIFFLGKIYLLLSIVL